MKSLFGNNRKNKKKLSFSWAGGLSNISDKTDSVSLQHQVSLWR